MNISETKCVVLGRMEVGSNKMFLAKKGLYFVVVALLNLGNNTCFLSLVKTYIYRFTTPIFLVYIRIFSLEHKYDEMFR